MARRKERGFDSIVKLPWPAGIVVGIIGYVAIRYGIGRQSPGANVVTLAWIALIVCWAAAIASFLQGRQRKQVPPAQDAHISSEQTASTNTDAGSAANPQSAAGPSCPTCGAAMFKRFSRQTNQMFWGCTHYPRCKGTKAV